MSRRSGIGFCSFKNDYFKCIQLISDGFIKDGKFTYSLPISYIRKIYELYSLKKLPSSCTIYYNDSLYDISNYLHCFSDYFKSTFVPGHPLYDFLISKDPSINIFSLYCCNHIKFEPMTSLCNKICYNISKGREYFFKIRKDFDKYYYDNFNDGGYFKEPSKILDFLNGYYNFLFVLN